MSAAFLFAGQGAEVPGMGLGLGAAMAPWFERLHALTGLDVERALRRGDPALRASEHLQPTLVAIQLATVAVLADSGVHANVLAGHSLGELAAVAASGALDHERTVRLAALRGKLMGEAARAHPGGMVAVDRRCELAGLELAAHNAADEWVMTGANTDIERALATTRATRLPVAGPWHSRYMSDAALAFRRALSDVPFTEAQVPVIANRDGAVGDDWAEMIAGQLTRPIAWVAVLEALRARAVDTIVTIGPGKVMRGLVRKTLGDVRVLGTEDERDLARTIEVLA